MKNVLLGLLIILFSIISCKDSSRTSTQQEIATSSPSVSEQKEYQLDTTKSKIKWTGYKVQKSLNLNHFGTMKLKEGTLIFNHGLPESGTLTADLSSLQDEDLEDTNQNKKLTDLLKSKDFFDTNTYPLSTFTITSSQKIEGASDFNTEIKGTLKLKNISKDILVKANIRTEDNTIFLNTEKFSVKRQDFGITYTGTKDMFIGEDFDLQISLTANSVK